MYSYSVSFGGTVSVCCPEIRGCLYLRGCKCIISMAKSIGSMLVVHCQYGGGPYLGESIMGGSTAINGTRKMEYWIFASKNWARLKHN